MSRNTTVVVDSSSNQSAINSHSPSSTRIETKEFAEDPRMNRPKEMVNDPSSPTFPYMFWGGNIAEKVKLSRRKASMKMMNESTSTPAKEEKTAKKKQTLDVVPQKVKEGMGSENRGPMRIKLKMNPKKRAKLSSDNKSSCDAPPISRPPLQKRQSKKHLQRKTVKSRAHVSDSSSSGCSDSSSSSDSSSISSGCDSSSSSSSDSDSDSDSSSGSSSSSGDSSSSGESSSSESSKSTERRRKRHKMNLCKPPKRVTGPKLKVRGKPKKRYSDMVTKAEAKEMECLAETCPNPPCERALTEAEIRNILGDDEGMACTSSSWVRRSTRQPSRSAVTSPNVRALVGKLEMNDPEMVVLKCKKYLPSSDTPAVIVDTMLDALERNTNCQALYIQNFNNGMRDDQVLHLLRILQSPSCNIWCLNIGETYNVKRRTWAQFTMGLRKTKITHMYASEHTISSAMKEKIREIIRDNRKKHNMHIDPNNLDVIVQCTHCWWNPINAQALRPYIQQRGYEYILNDKVAQGTKDAGNTEPE